MKKYICYIPAVLFTTYYLLSSVSGTNFVWPIKIAWVICFWISALLFHKGSLLGGVFGLLPATHMIYMREHFNELLFGIKIPLGIPTLFFYMVFTFYLFFKNEDSIRKVENTEVWTVFIKMILTVIAIIASTYMAVVSWSFLISKELLPGFAYISTIFPFSLSIPLIWLKKRKTFVIRWLLIAFMYFLALGINFAKTL